MRVQRVTGPFSVIRMETKALSPYPERTILGMLKSTKTKPGSPSRSLKTYSEVSIFAHDLRSTLKMDTQAILSAESDYFSELGVMAAVLQKPESLWEVVTIAKVQLDEHKYEAQETKPLALPFGILGRKIVNCNSCKDKISCWTLIPTEYV